MPLLIRVFSTTWLVIGLTLVAATSYSTEIKKLDAGPDIPVNYPEPVIPQGAVKVTH